MLSASPRRLGIEKGASLVCATSCRAGGPAASIIALYASKFQTLDWHAGLRVIARGLAPLRASARNHNRRNQGADDDDSAENLPLHLKDTTCFCVLHPAGAGKEQYPYQNRCEIFHMSFSLLPDCHLCATRELVIARGRLGRRGRGRWLASSRRGAGRGRSGGCGARPRPCGAGGSS